MKTLLKVLGGLLILLLTAAFALPIIYKDDIVTKVKSTVNESVNAKVSFGDFSLSFFKSFPHLTFSMEDVMVIGVDSFSNDTLANIKELNTVVDIMSIIQGDQIKINSINLYKANLNIIVLPSGKANWDIAKADTSTTAVVDTTATKFNIELTSYSLEKSNIVYDDRSLTFYTSLKNVDHKGSGDFTQDLFTLLTETTAEELTVSFAGVPYLNKVKAKVVAPIEMNMKDFIFTFKENTFNINDLIIDFAGSVAMPDTNIDLDLTFDAKKSEFKNFLSLIPAIYSSSFDDLQANGKFAMKGYYKGRMNAISMPGFGIDIIIEDGNFKYPDLPTGVNNVQMNLVVDDKDGVFDHTIVDLKKLHVEFGTEPFDATLTLKTPESDPDINTTVKGKIDLANILKIVPIEDTKLSGIINTDFSASGKLSTIEKGNYESFNAKGNISINNLNYSSKASPLPLTIQSANFNLSPQYIALSNLKAKYGKSDFAADGKLENYIAYALKGSTIKARLDFRSQLFDVNEMMGPESTEATTTETSDTLSVIEIPANIDFVLNSKINAIKYDNMDINNLAGSIIIKDKKLSFEGVSLNTLDASVKMDGYYSTTDIKKPDVDMNFVIQNMDIQKAFKTFNTVQKLAPIAENTTGKFNGSLSFNTILGNDMSPVLNTTQGAGSLELLGTSIKGSKLFVKVSDALKTDKLKELNIKNTKLQFKIIDGRVVVQPFDVATSVANFNIGGSSGLDQSIDYVLKIKLPKNALGSAGADVINGLTSALNKNLPGYKTSDEINVNALVGGLVSQPTVKLSMADIGSNLKSAVKDALNDKKDAAVARGKEEARKRAEQILAAAQNQANMIKQEARNLADQTRKQGYAAADKLVAEANNPIAKAAAKKLAEKMKKETDEKANKIIAEGDKKADAVLTKARTEADALLK